MPTGYTAILIDEPETTFAEFAMRCARNFGACVMQRDDGLDVPLSLAEQPSDFYSNRHREASERLAWLENATDEQLAAEQAEAIRKAREYHDSEIVKHDALWNVLTSMKMRVSTWVPPSADHCGLKKFMLEQLESTMAFDCDTSYHVEQLKKLRELPASEYRQQQLAKAVHDEQYHLIEYAKEVERVNARNEWKRQLIDSLKE